MNESSKAMRRRLIETEYNIFNWNSIFVGNGIDIGCGPDLIWYDNCRPFDMEDGDANKISQYFKKEQFDYVHASQCLEHMNNPVLAIKEWSKILKKGGYAIISIPDWTLYEGFIFPSRWNPDHKSTWSFTHKESSCSQHMNIYNFLNEISDIFWCKRYMLVDNNYNYDLLINSDQTYKETDCVEAFIELILCKL